MSQHGALGPAPRVGIGMPVYNGANFIVDAIESVLAQTFEDFELLICDNASTDETADICRTYVDKDERVRYVRNRWNIGAGPNNNRVFELSRGEFFKIANHDDINEPRFVERCVALLDERPDAVCAFPSTVDVDATGAVVRDLPRRPAFASDDAATRIWEALEFGQEPMAIFGVMRADVVAKTGLMTAVPSADRIWLAELLMHGPFVEVTEPLFLHREHEQRSVHAAGKGHASLAWWDPKAVGSFQFPYWRMLRRLGEAIERSPLDGRDRRKAYGLLLRWARTNKHHLKLAYDAALPLRGLIDRYYTGATTTRG